jgi:hypothetical protein
MRSYEDDGEKIMITYNGRLDDRTPIFTASADADQFIIKFTRRYSESAHRYLAELGFAPRLRQFVSLLVAGMRS